MARAADPRCRWRPTCAAHAPHTGGPHQPRDPLAADVRCPGRPAPRAPGAPRMCPDSRWIVCSCIVSSASPLRSRRRGAAMPPQHPLGGDPEHAAHDGDRMVGRRPFTTRTKSRGDGIRRGYLGTTPRLFGGSRASSRSTRTPLGAGAALLPLLRRSGHPAAACVPRGLHRPVSDGVCQGSTCVQLSLGASGRHAQLDQPVGTVSTKRGKSTATTANRQQRADRRAQQQETTAIAG